MMGDCCEKIIVDPRTSCLFELPFHAPTLAKEVRDMDSAAVKA